VIEDPRDPRAQRPIHLNFGRTAAARRKRKEEAREATEVQQRLKREFYERDQRRAA